MTPEGTLLEPSSDSNKEDKAGYTMLVKAEGRGDRAVSSASDTGATSSLTVEGVGVLEAGEAATGGAS